MSPGTSSSTSALIPSLSSTPLYLLGGALAVCWKFGDWSFGHAWKPLPIYAYGVMLGTSLVAGWFLVIVEIQKMYQADGRESPVEPIEGLWLLIPIAGWFLYMNRVQVALNDYWVSKGAAPLPS